MAHGTLRYCARWTHSFTCAKLSTLIESLCCTTLTLLVCVPVCPQSWSLPHQLSSPLLCLLTLSLPPSPPAPPPPCVEMVHIMCLQTHAYRQWPPHTDKQHNIHIYVRHYTPSHNTPSHAHNKQSYAMYRDSMPQYSLALRAGLCLLQHI